MELRLGIRAPPAPEDIMLTREITLPVSARELWEALTDPAAVSSWLGSEVDWTLEPGAPARFRRGEDGDRDGRVDEVRPGRRLAFQWWPEADPAEVSEVTYELEPSGEGTRLTVSERRMAAPATQVCAEGWSTWDTCFAGLWMLLAEGRRGAWMADRGVLAGSAGLQPVA
jgi:uncharacterized protein YndB with AHSA1/START domain